MTPEQIARVCHEANRAYCESTGDTSQLAWDDAPEWQRQSAIRGAEFTQNCPDISAAGQHEKWWADKKADGWVYGPEKDAEAKTHPCMVPYCRLPEQQQRKDHMFKAIALALSQPMAGN